MQTKLIKLCEKVYVDRYVFDLIREYLKSNNCNNVMVSNLSVNTLHIIFEKLLNLKYVNIEYDAQYKFDIFKTTKNGFKYLNEKGINLPILKFNNEILNDEEIIL